MKIVQVLTYVSIDGAYGGPVAVARAQCEGLAMRGHDVTLVAGWDGLAELAIPGVDVRLLKVHRLPRLGFAGMFSLPLVRLVRRLAGDADIVHLHFARDLVQLGVSLGLGSRGAVLQCHGMVRPDSRLPARVVDALVVRGTYRRATAHLVLVPAERAAIDAISRGQVASTSVFSVRNGVPAPRKRASWCGGDPRVAFISRLHPRKRPVAFVEMADLLVRDGCSASFVVHGGDEGERAGVLEMIHARGLADRVTCPGPLEPDSVLETMAGCQVFVLPSFEEPFPMAVLEAMSVGLPSVVTDRTGISVELREHGGATVTDGTPGELAGAVRDLLASRETWEAAAERAVRQVEQRFGAEAMVDRVEEVYELVR